MKILFAVNSESVSEAIIKKYQNDYREIISYKNVYYFNAIQKEIQQDKSYDRIIISEDLEPFSNNNYESMDKFIFEKLDGISDESDELDENKNAIILICSDRHTKGSQFLVKLFGLGIYNALIGGDRSFEEVCRLIKKPRTKKDAKAYYQIDINGVGYKAIKEDEVSEQEIQSIIAYFKKLGKNSQKYASSFEKIASQYTDQQIKIIINCLPLKVKSILEETSEKYQEIMAVNGKMVQGIKSTTSRIKNAEKRTGIKVDIIENKIKENKITKPIVIPNTIKSNVEKKVVKVEPVSPQENNERNILEEPHKKVQVQPAKKKSELTIEEKKRILRERKAKQLELKKRALLKKKAEIRARKLEQLKAQQQKEQQEKEIKIENEEKIKVQEDEIPSTEKKGRGRPRKNPVETQEKPKGKRGRPRKNPVEEEIKLESDDENLIDFDTDFSQDTEENKQVIKNELEFNDNVDLPELDELDDITDIDESIEKENNYTENEEDSIIQRLDDEEPEESKESELISDFEDKNEFEDVDLLDFDDIENEEVSIDKNTELKSIEPIINYSMSNLNSLLTKDKKIVTFVGTSKNGTSFLINNLAELFATIGINTAILDMTQNKNAYYIYTDNEEKLRKIAYNSLTNLQNGVAEGIKVKPNLTVYTALPNDGNDYSNAEPILSTLVQNHSLVLIDCDFQTDPSYFASAQEIYLVQSLDVLTIQPLTAFLRDLLYKGVLEQEKIKVVINKEVKVRKITAKDIVRGMSVYNDSTMSIMTELFNKDTVKYCSIPFEDAVYSKYLYQIADCKISLNGYSKTFINKLKILGDMVYPLTSRQTYSSSQAKNYTNTKFSNNTNDILNKMKKKY